MSNRSDWWPGDIVAEPATCQVYKFIGDKSYTRWAGLTGYDLQQGYDPKEPVLLARLFDGQLIPAIDVEGRILVAVDRD